jgi:hypothetical protein
MYYAINKKTNVQFEFEWASNDDFFILKNGKKEIADVKEFDIVEEEDKVLVLFGEFSFLDERIMANREAHVYYIKEAILVDRKTATKEAEAIIGTGKHDAYLIPQLYDGKILW